MALVLRDRRIIPSEAKFLINDRELILPYLEAYQGSCESLWQKREYVCTATE